MCFVVVMYTRSPLTVKTRGIVGSHFRLDTFVCPVRHAKWSDLLQRKTKMFIVGPAVSPRYILFVS